MHQPVAQRGLLLALLEVEVVRLPVQAAIEHTPSLAESVGQRIDVLRFCGGVVVRCALCKAQPNGRRPTKTRHIESEFRVVREQHNAL